MAVTGVALVIWACALPYLRLTTGSTSESIFHSGNQGGVWFAAEPVGVAVIAIVAAVLLMAAARARSLRWLAAGMLAAFGTQTVLLFTGYQFGITGAGIHSGSAGVVGILGGLTILLAGALGIASGAVGRAAGDPVRAAASGSWG
jgi:hypothetical protein